MKKLILRLCSVSTLSPSTSLGMVCMVVSLPNHKPRLLSRRKSNGLIFTIGLGFLLLGLTASGFAATTGVDALIEKLVKKGILNRQEGISLKGEIAEDEKIVREEGLKQDLPSWVRDTKLKGDFRMRYQRDRKRATATQNEKSRFRMRFRTESKVSDQTKVYFGLASGSSADPRSTNQTFQDSFAKK